MTSDSDGGGIPVANGIGPPVHPATSSSGVALEDQQPLAASGDHHYVVTSD